MDIKEQARQRALEYFEKANIYLKEEEKNNIEVADMGLGMIDKIGIQIYTYIAAPRYSAKEMVLFPNQICPEQCHPPVAEGLGKEETFRVRYGELYVYTEGEAIDKSKIRAIIPERHENYFTVFHENILKKGDQFTVYPNTKHWLCGGPDGCVISEFATPNTDEVDIYTHPDINRMSGV